MNAPKTATRSARPSPESIAGRILALVERVEKATSGMLFAAIGGHQSSISSACHRLERQGWLVACDVTRGAGQQPAKLYAAGSGIPSSFRPLHSRRGLRPPQRLETTCAPRAPAQPEVAATNTGSGPSVSSPSSLPTEGPAVGSQEQAVSAAGSWPDECPPPPVAAAPGPFGANCVPVSNAARFWISSEGETIIDDGELRMVLPAELAAKLGTFLGYFA